MLEHQQLWRDRTLEIQQEVKNLDAQITKLTPPLEFKDGGRVPSLEELATQVKAYEIELETLKAQSHQCSMNAKNLDPKMVSDFHKQLEKDIQQHIDRDDTKPTADDGMTLKQKKKIRSIQLEYYRLCKTKTPQTAKNMIMKKYDIKPKSLKSYLTKDPKLPK